MISNIKGINAIGDNNEIDVQIDEKFYSENLKEINKRIKSIDLKFKINFIQKTIPNIFFEFDKDLLLKMKNNTKEVIENNKIEDLNTEKSYRRKIKKKIEIQV